MRERERLISLFSLIVDEIKSIELELGLELLRVFQYACMTLKRDEIDDSSLTVLNDVFFKSLSTFLSYCKTSYNPLLC